jgi:hypothetical protein
LNFNFFFIFSFSKFIIKNKKMSVAKKINKYVLSSFGDKFGDEFKAMWTSETNQDGLKNLFNNKSKAKNNPYILFIRDEKEKEKNKGVTNNCFERVKYYSALWNQIKEKDDEVYRKYVDLAKQNKIQNNKKTIPKVINKQGRTYVLKEKENDSRQDDDDDSMSIDEDHEIPMKDAAVEEEEKEDHVAVEEEEKEDHVAVEEEEKEEHVAVEEEEKEDHVAVEEEEKEDHVAVEEEEKEDHVAVEEEEKEDHVAVEEEEKKEEEKMKKPFDWSSDSDDDDFDFFNQKTPPSPRPFSPISSVTSNSKKRKMFSSDDEDDDDQPMKKKQMFLCENCGASFQAQAHLDHHVSIHNPQNSEEKKRGRPKGKKNGEKKEKVIKEKKSKKVVSEDDDSE